MAGKTTHFYYFYLTILFLQNIFAYSINTKIFEIKKNNIETRSHLKNAKIKFFCANRDMYCRYNGSNVCSFRKIKQSNVFKDFENVCYLFMSNMCDYPGKEFYVISSGSCENYLATRPFEYNSIETARKAGNIKNSTKTENDNNETITTEKFILRNNNTITTLYPVDEAYDLHPCPYSCPNTYSPQCINVNRGMGKYFKMLTFVNHCMADLYYCKHFNEFQIPPDEDEAIVSSSPLGWSYCGASRYLQFARFAEVTSSMGHYGWLSGNYRYSHIMEPHQRLPGYG